MTQIVLTNHAKARLIERGIGVHDAKKIAKNGEIVGHEENGLLKRRGLSYDKRRIIVISKEGKGKIIILSAYYEN